MTLNMSLIVQLILAPILLGIFAVNFARSQRLLMALSAIMLFGDGVLIGVTLRFMGRL